MLCKFSRLSVALGALVGLSAAVGWDAPCQAATILGDPIALSELLDDGIVVVEDKEFSDFTYSFTNDMPDAGGINVIPIQDDDGNYGIRFQGSFIDLPSSQGGSDAFITYNVKVTDPRYLISDAHLQGNPNVLGDVGSISVTETFLPLGQNGEYTMEIFDDENLDEAVIADWTFFDPWVSMLSVQKDILALALEDSQSATMSFVDQTFSQIIIPEPTTLLLSIVGIVGIGFGFVMKNCGLSRKDDN